MYNERDVERWKTEISIVADGILSWLQNHNNDPKEPIVDAIKRIALMDCMILGVEDALWAAMEAWDYIDREYEHSDVWQCAVAEAIERFKAQFVLAEVAS